MATIIGTVKDLSGKFFAKDTDGNIVELKEGDVITEGMVVYGDESNTAFDTINIAMENGSDDIVLSGLDEQLFDSSLSDEFNFEDALAADSVDDVLDGDLYADEDLDEASNEDDNINFDETAAGDEPPKTSEAGEGNFEQRDGRATDIVADLRDAPFVPNTQVPNQQNQPVDNLDLDYRTTEEFEDTRMVEETFTNTREEFETFTNTRDVEVEFEDTRVVPQTFTNTSVQTEEFEDTRMVEESFTNTRIESETFTNTREEVQTFTNTRVETEEFQNTRTVDAPDSIGIRNTTTVDTAAMNAAGYELVDGEWVKVTTETFTNSRIETQEFEDTRDVVVEFENTRVETENFTNTRDVLVEFQDTRDVTITAQPDQIIYETETYVVDDNIYEETFTDTREVEVEFEDTRVVTVEFEDTRDVEVEFEDTRMVEETFTNTREEVETFTNTRIEQEEFQNTRIVDGEDIIGTRATTTVDTTAMSEAGYELVDGEWVKTISENFTNTRVETQDFTNTRDVIVEFEDSREITVTAKDDQIIYETEIYVVDDNIYEETFTDTREVEVEFEDTRLVEESFTNTREESETFTNTRIETEEFQNTRIVDGEDSIGIRNTTTVDTTAMTTAGYELVDGEWVKTVTENFTNTRVETEEFTDTRDVIVEFQDTREVITPLQEEQIIYETETYVVDDNIYEETFTDTRDVEVEFQDTRMVEETFTNTRIEQEEFQNTRTVDGEDILGERDTTTVDVTAMRELGYTNEALLFSESFEDNNYSGSWSVVDDKDWDETNGVEVQDSGVTVTPTDGEKVAELDAHQNTQLSKDFDTSNVTSFTISFDYQPRRDSESSDMSITINGQTYNLSHDGTASAGVVITVGENGWSNYSITTPTDSQTTNVIISSEGTSDSYGALIDNIKVVGTGDGWYKEIEETFTNTRVETQEFTNTRDVTVEFEDTRELTIVAQPEQIIYETETYVVDDNVYEETFTDTRDVEVEFQDTRMVEETFTNTRIEQEEFQNTRMVDGEDTIGTRDTTTVDTTAMTNAGFTYVESESTPADIIYKDGTPQTATTNLTFVMDVSSSMSDTDLSLSEDAINKIVSQYEEIGGVNVNIVQFWGDNAESSGWVDGSTLDADNMLYTNKSGTDPEQGMRLAETTFGDAPTADQNVLIQMGDGNAYGDYEDDFLDYLPDFKEFISENMDAMYTVGINVNSLHDLDYAAGLAQPPEISDAEYATHIDISSIANPTIYADDVNDLNSIIDDIAQVELTQVVDTEAMIQAGYELVDGVWMQSVDGHWESTTTETFTNSRVETQEFEDTRMVEETFTNTKVELQDITTTYSDVDANLNQAGDFLAYDLDDTHSVDLLIKSYKVSKDEGEIILYKDAQEVDRIDLDTVYDEQGLKDNMDVSLEVTSSHTFDSIKIFHTGEGAGGGTNSQEFKIGNVSITAQKEVEIEFEDTRMVEETFTNTREVTVEFEDTRDVTTTVSSDQIIYETETYTIAGEPYEETFTDTRDVEVEFEDTRMVPETFTNTRTEIQEFQNTRVVDGEDILGTRVTTTVDAVAMSEAGYELVDGEWIKTTTENFTNTRVETQEFTDTRDVTVEFEDTRTVIVEAEQLVYETETYVVDDNIYEETFTDTRDVEVEFEDTRMVPETFTNTRIEQEEFENTRVVDGEDIMGTRETTTIDTTAMSAAGYSLVDGEWVQTTTQEFTNSRIESEEFTNTRDIVVEFEDTRDITVTASPDQIIYETETYVVDDNIYEETFTDTREVEVEFEDTRMVTVEFEDTRMVPETFTNTRTEIQEFQNTRVVDGEDILGTRVTTTVDAVAMSEAGYELVDGEWIKTTTENFTNTRIDQEEFTDTRDVLVEFEDSREITVTALPDQVIYETETYVADDNIYEEVFTDTRDVEVTFEDTRVVTVEFEDVRMVSQTFTNTRTETETFINTREEVQTFTNTRVETEEFQNTRIVDGEDEIGIRNTTTVDAAAMGVAGYELVDGEWVKTTTESFTNVRVEQEEFEDSREVVATFDDTRVESETFTNTRDVRVDFEDSRTLTVVAQPDQIIYETETYVVDENIYEETFTDTREVTVEFEDTRVVTVEFEDTRDVEVEFEDVRMVQESFINTRDVVVEFEDTREVEETFINTRVETQEFEDVREVIVEFEDVRMVEETFTNTREVDISDEDALTMNPEELILDFSKLDNEVDFALVVDEMAGTEVNVIDIADKDVVDINLNDLLEASKDDSIRIEGDEGSSLEFNDTESTLTQTGSSEEYNTFEYTSNDTSIEIKVDNQVDVVS